MPNNKSHGSPYKMKAGKMGPMQKNFGPELAINKTLDKKSMPGGMTGQPGKTLDGPLAKKKGGQTPTATKVKTPKVKKSIFKKPTAAQQAKRDKLKSDVKSFGKGLKKAGSDVNKKLQKAGKYMSAKSIKARKAAKTASKAKVGEFSTKKKLEGSLVPNQKLMKTKVDKKVKKEKIDHNKGLKGKTGQARTDYYDKHNLKHDKTITTKKKK